jgi:starch phosphorylase
VRVDPESIFDVQVKRIHEYKRQLLNVMHVIALYNRIRAGESAESLTPRTVIFSGKAAPGYFRAKQIIHLINAVAERINRDPAIGDRLKVAFLPNYSVSLAEKIFPGSDLSEQISTAGMEASGTGNMKFALNGALTIGTLDGANIEIMEEVGEENIFIFGKTESQIAELRRTGYDPNSFVEDDDELKQLLHQIRDGFFSPNDPDLFRPIYDSMMSGGDYYCHLPDYRPYADCQQRVARLYCDPTNWTRMAILNVARIGKFSSDRVVQRYADEIWKVVPCPVDRSESKMRRSGTERRA